MILQFIRGDLSLCWFKAEPKRTQPSESSINKQQTSYLKILVIITTTQRVTKALIFNWSVGLGTKIHFVYVEASGYQTFPLVTDFSLLSAPKCLRIDRPVSIKHSRNSWMPGGMALLLNLFFITEEHLRTFGSQLVSLIAWIIDLWCR